MKLSFLQLAKKITPIRLLAKSAVTRNQSAEDSTETTVNLKTVMVTVKVIT
jgi:hypothetical protein